MSKILFKTGNAKTHFFIVPSYYFTFGTLDDKSALEKKKADFLKLCEEHSVSAAWLTDNGCRVTIINKDYTEAKAVQEKMFEHKPTEFQFDDYMVNWLGASLADSIAVLEGTYPDEFLIHKQDVVERWSFEMDVNRYEIAVAVGVEDDIDYEVSRNVYKMLLHQIRESLKPLAKPTELDLFVKFLQDARVHFIDRAKDFGFSQIGTDQYKGYVSCMDMMIEKAKEFQKT